MLMNGRAGSTLFLIALSILLASLPARGFEDGAGVNVGSYRVLHSEILGEERTILVHLPVGYESAESHYPVFYMLDGNHKAGYLRAAADVSEMAESGLAPPMILVAIANADRTRDMFPVKVDGRPTSGGAPDFLRFLAEELIPFIDREYRTVDFRILMGQSNSGLFATYAMLKDPDLFNGVIASSPMLGWCSAFVHSLVVPAFTGELDGNRWFFMVYGNEDYEHVADAVPSFVDLLRREAPARLKWDVTILKGEGHVPSAGLGMGMRFIFSGFKISDEERSAGLDRLRRHYSDLSKRYGFTIHTPASVLLHVGAPFLDEGKNEEALELFRHCVLTNPRSAWCHYYLGRAYFEIGERDEAIRSLRAALELLPGLSGARKLLEELEG